MKKLFWVFMICLIFCLCSCDINSKLTFYSVVVIDDGDVIDSRAVVKNSEYTIPDAKNVDGFRGWKVGNSSTLVRSGNRVKITSDTTITAVREDSPTPEYCSVVVLSRGNVVESKVVLKSSDYMLPAPPDGTGFKGWRVGDAATTKDAWSLITITADTQITAEWADVSEAEYCSVVVLNKGELLESRILLYNSVYTLPDAPVGNGFKGWRVGNSELLVEPGISVNITSDITITAVWTETSASEPKYYAVVVIDDGSIVDASAVKEGESYMLPSPSSRQGYFFNGWKVGDNSSCISAGETIKITGNTAIKADWTAIYTLIVEVPQNVTNVQAVTVNVGSDIKFASRYGNYTSAFDGYYQYSFKLMNTEGEYSVTACVGPSGVTKTVSLNVGEDADKTMIIRLADKSEVIDLSTISVNRSLKTKVDSNYNLSEYIKISVPDGVNILYTIGGRVGELGDTLYQNGESILLESGVMLSISAVVNDRLVTGSRYQGFMIEISSAVGATGPAGGYVFYDKGEVSDGWRMLEAGKSVLSSIYQWGSYTSALSTPANLGCGKSSTEELINAMGSDSSLSFPAAEAVWNVDVYGNGYTDWFLPSNFDMDAMYPVLTRCGVAGSIELIGTSCWTSTSSGYFDAFCTDMWNGSTNYIGRGSGMKVWPIRQF